MVSGNACKFFFGLINATNYFQKKTHKNCSNFPALSQGDIISQRKNTKPL